MHKTAVAILGTLLSLTIGSSRAPLAADAVAPRGTQPAVGTEAEGVRWTDLRVEEGIASAARSGKPVLLYVWASWCGPCKRLASEIWSTPAGSELGGRTTPVRVDFESEYGQGIKRRYNIIGLPSVLVLDGRGQEIDRIVGYEEREEWLGQVRPAVEGTDPIPALESKLASEPDSTAILLELARRRLYRGDEVRAFSEFLRILALDPAPEIDAEIWFLLGRYHQRVRERPADALPFWKHLAEAHPNTDYLPGAVAWGLDAHKALGRVALGLAWASAVSAGRPQDGEIHYLIASWAHESGLRDPVALEHAKQAKALGVEATDLDEVLASLSASP